MKSMILAATFAAVPGPSVAPVVAPNLSFDGATPLMTPALMPIPLSLIPTPVPVLMPALSAASIETRSMNEFSRVPSWFDASRLSFDALFKAEGGGTVVMRYGWRSQYEMTVFAFPGGASVAFTEYAASPMDHPKQSFEASLETPAARKAAAKIIRDVQARKPVEDKYKAVLEKVLAFLDGR